MTECGKGYDGKLRDWNYSKKSGAALQNFLSLNIASTG
jgi:hypothetical protein